MFFGKIARDEEIHVQRHQEFQSGDEEGEGVEALKRRSVEALRAARFHAFIF